jgi:hypothetical protein
MRSATTLTFGECAENHVGMQKLGGVADEGFTYGELAAAKWRFEALGYECELVDLISRGRVEEYDPEPAHVLIVRRGVEALLGGATADDLRAEQGGLDVDKQALMYGRVVNKNARHNLCFNDEAQEPAYAQGRGRVVAFADVPLLATARSQIGRLFGPKAVNLYAEGNYYFDVAKCGIGFHGDAERRIVVALRLGAPILLHYQWFLRSRPIGSRIPLALGHGDLYAMSEKAVGTDWKSSSFPTLRHAAGCRKYLTI